MRPPGEAVAAGDGAGVVGLSGGVAACSTETIARASRPRSRARSPLTARRANLIRSASVNTRVSRPSGTVGNACAARWSSVLVSDNAARVWRAAR